jgi:hypothetical protein
VNSFRSMTKFKPKDQVRIIEDGKNSETTYTIKAIKKSRDGKLLYLLRSQDNESILRLYYENGNSGLSKVD